MSVSGFQLETPVPVVGRGFVERRQLLWEQHLPKPITGLNKSLLKTK